VTVQVREHQKTPLWRNGLVLRWTAQLLVLFGFVAFFFILGKRASDNFATSGTTFGWSWLTDPSDFLVREGIDLDPDSGIRALAVGAMNTLRVSITGIIAATILGTLIGVGRLSNNWIVSKISTIYVETIRNIPLLVQIIFWQATVITLPGLVADDIGTYWFKGSNKGFAFAWTHWNGGFLPWLVFLAFGVGVGRYVMHKRTRHQEETGNPAHAGGWFGLTLLAFAIVGWFAWPVLFWVEPILAGIAGFIDGIPPIIIPIILAVAALGGATLRIRNFFESRRTPAGFGKLTDDDYFRIIFVGISGIVLAFLAFVIAGLTFTTVAGETLNIAELIRLGISNVFDWVARGFAADGGQPLEFSKASVQQTGNFVQYGTTGAVLTVPFFAIWWGVTLYHASFIAEVVRGGILAVSKGQTEAAQAVGLKRSQLLRLVVLPQAFRIILPPMGNQYLGVFKNTTLGIAVAYSEIVSVGTTLYNKNGQTFPIVLVWMAFFLTGSLLISAVVNYYNRKMKLVER
jgi:general L-amino acid transport system permease protein